MAKNTFYILNGEIERAENYNLPYSEVFTGCEYVEETIRLYNTHPLFLQSHIQKICNTLDILAIAHPLKFDTQRISRFVTRLLNINKVYKGGICKIIVFRKSDIFMGIDYKNIHFAIFIEPLPKLDYEFNSEGLHIGCNASIQIFPPYLPSKYNLHSVIQNKTITLAKMQNLDALCYYNYNNSIFASSLGDIMYVSDNKIYTPNSVLNPFRHPLSENLMLFAQKNGYEFIQVNSISEKDLLQADEVFLVHTIYGIQWVNTTNESTYGYKTSKKIYQLLLKMILLVSNN